MPRTEVYQLRLTSGEKEELAYAASMNGGSIAKLIRDTFGLGNRTHRKVPVPSPGSRPGASDGLCLTEEEAIAALAEAKSKELTRLTKQLEAQGNPDAEGVARKRLGM